jgi:hypothetical protein
MTALVGVSVYLRRFGSRYATLGIMLWAGSVMSYFLHGEFRESQLGWIAAELAIGTTVANLVRSTLFRPHRGKELHRLRRSALARARRVMRLSARRFSAGNTGRRSQVALDRALLRLNETILMIDARIAAVTTTQTTELARAAYDVELALSRVARMATRLAAVRLADADRGLIAGVLAALSVGDVDAAGVMIASGKRRQAGNQSPEHEELLTRFASAVTGLLDSLRSERRALGAATGPVKAPVSLIGGWLPGSAIVSGKASMSSGSGWAGRIRLPPYLRSSVQITVAVGIALVLGDVVSPQGFYWAMIAAFTAFMGGSNAAENSWRALWRVAGTALGIFAAIALAGVIGDQAAGWNIALVLIALFLGIYLNRISYFFMTFGLTIAISRLYAELGEYTSHLLYQRLEETAIGGGVAVAVAFLVLPLRSAKVLRTGLDSYRASLTSLLAALREQMDDLGTRPSLRDEIRDLDASYQAVHAIAAPAKPMRRTRRPGDAALDAVTRTRADVRAMAAEVARIGATRPVPRTFTVHGYESVRAINDFLDAQGIAILKELLALVRPGAGKGDNEGQAPPSAAQILDGIKVALDEGVDPGSAKYTALAERIRRLRYRIIQSAQDALDFLAEALRIARAIVDAEKHPDEGAPTVTSTRRWTSITGSHRCRTLFSLTGPAIGGCGSGRTGWPRLCPGTWSWRRSG